MSTAKRPGPRYQLPDNQIAAIKAALAERPRIDTEQVALAKTLTAFNCIACHIRDDYGGVPEAYNSYFQSSEKNLGDDARIPPPLTLTGAKLQPAWMKKVLFDGESVRPYMATRMPQFGTVNLQHVPELFTRLDVLKGPELIIPESDSKNAKDRDLAKVLRPAGRELLGDKGLNCVNCHNFNGKPSPTNRGIDLMTSYERLQPGWFKTFILNPGALRPRIVMPTAWPDGVATHKKILDGNTDQQIAAIWFYLSLGTSAADPPGIRVEATKLAVGAQARSPPRSQPRRRLSRDRRGPPREAELRDERRNRNAECHLARRFRQRQLARAGGWRFYPGKRCDHATAGCFICAAGRRQDTLAAAAGDDQRSTGQSYSAVSQESRLSISWLQARGTIDPDLYVFRAARFKSKIVLLQWEALGNGN